MSYNFNQFRFGMIAASEYMTPQQYTFENFRTPSLLIIGKDFVDNEMNYIFNKEVGKNRSYYLKIKIKQQETIQNLRIFLYNSTNVSEPEQKIVNITVMIGNDYEYFEMVLTPNNNYNKIQFVLERENIDYLTENDDGTIGRKIDLEILNFSEINNIIDKIDDVTLFKQIGVQSSPNLLMCIDGEPIKVGRTGIYEINNGVFVSFLGFIIEPEEPKNFILDYQY